MMALSLSLTDSSSLTARDSVSAMVWLSDTS